MKSGPGWRYLTLPTLEHMFYPRLMQHYTPALAWLESAAPNSPPTLAFVLSWEQRADRRGHKSWWALVAVPRGGGVLPPSMEIRWEWEVKVRPAVVEPPE